MPGTRPWSGLALTLLLAVLLLQAAMPQLDSLFYPDGDFAADLLLVNALDSQGYLLTGHYSRFGFNHPGPVFFYLNALFEQLGSLFDLPRANAWTLCTLATNLAFVLLIARLLPRLFGRTFSPLSLAAALPILLVLGPNFFTVWMPYRVFLPFAAFYLALLLLKEGPVPRLATTRLEKHCVVSADAPGIVTFGPYIHLKPGQYRFDLEYTAPGGLQERIGHWDAVTDKGQFPLANGVLTGTGGLPEKISGRLVLNRYSETEIRTLLEPGRRLSIHKMTLTRE